MDADDRAAFLASLYRRLGFETRFQFVRERGRISGIDVQIKDGDRWKTVQLPKWCC